MNDRFRFRAWNKEKREMLYGVEEGRYGLSFLEIIQSDNYIVEQYTGLRDANGRLIYEGDIVWLENEDEYEYAKIVWDENLAQFAILTHIEYFSFDNMFPTEMQVMGNIHENPELLESGNE